MDDRFKIYTEQLRHGQVEHLAESFSADFLDVHEADLAFVSPVIVNGEAYLADDMLVLHLDVSTSAQLPCTICNEPVKVALVLKGVYQAIPLAEIKSGIFNFRELLRETILLEVPLLAECEQGKCPRREEIGRFLADPTKGTQPGPEDGYHPFADLDLDR